MSNLASPVHRPGRRLRRALALGVAGLAMLVASGAALGAFGASVDAGQLSVQTATLDAPTGLAAKNNCKPNTHNKVKLTWTDSASPAVAGYEIDRSGDGGATFNKVKRVNASKSKMQDNSIAGSTSYEYEIFAYRNKWSSPLSNVVSITTLDPTTCT